MYIKIHYNSIIGIIFQAFFPTVEPIRIHFKHQMAKLHCMFKNSMLLSINVNANIVVIVINLDVKGP